MLRLVCLLAVAFFAAEPGRAAAQGIVLDAQPPGEAGFQMDMAAISPAPLPATVPVYRPVAGQTYVVKPGDSLSRVAEALGVDPAEVVAQNGIRNPDHLEVGQQLCVNVREPLTPALLLPGGPLTRVQFWPWPPLQGQTLVAWLRLAEPMTVTASFGGRRYPVNTNGGQGWLLLPVPPLAAPGVQSLALTTARGTVTLTIPIEAGSFPSDNVPASTTDAILGDTQRVAAEAQRVAALFATHNPGPFGPHSRFEEPLNGQYAHTSPFGSRRTYGNSTVVTFHAGEDYGAPPGTPVLAPSPGTVVLAEPLFVRGNAVILDHGQGVYTGYWHLRAIGVQAGDQVKTGQELGQVGSTGLSTGAHLHWEMQVGAVPVDPLQWLAPPAVR